MDFFNKNKIKNLLDCNGEQQKKIQNLEEQNEKLRDCNKMQFETLGTQQEKINTLEDENKTLKKFDNYFPVYRDKVNKIINEKIEIMYATGLVDTFKTTVNRVDNNEQTIQALQQQVQQMQNEIITKETVQSLINKVNELVVKLNTK